ncbi:MAG TPA: serine/threonine-protein kinase, partial [Pyrinomonadaceae bacterium]|nr:serine/threonine-protein kinase [Pyrinomonadaceae bacterium]
SGQMCIVMEYVDGQSLDEHIRFAGRMAAPDALRIFRGIVEGVAYIHGNGIIHRDIKSNNIKITAGGEVKLLDFGIARADSSPKLTVVGDVVGTFQYLSPEQLTGGTADLRSDIWALGVLLYEMLSGDVPFDGNSIGTLYEKITKGDYQQASNYNLTVSPAVDAIIARCLKRNPAARYQSADELLHDVSRAIDGDSAPSTGVSQTFKNLPGAFTQTHWLIMAGMILGGILLVTVLYFLLAAPGPQNESNTSNVSAFPSPGGSKKTVPAALQTNNNTSATDLNAEKVVTTINVDDSLGQADIWVNGEMRGQTPFKLEGPHGQAFDIVVKKDGFEDFKMQGFTVAVGRNQYLISERMMTKKNE